MSTPTSERPPTSTRRRPVLLILVGLLVVAAATVAASVTLSGPDEPPMTESAAAVMPFDLAATTHTFTKVPAGGVEDVVANDPADQSNTDAIRAHLAEEAAKFSAGDYSDPARIHGGDMPGLAELEANPDRVEVLYEQIPGGARIGYRAAEPSLIATIHTWFDAQNTDHAMPGMGMGN